MNRHVSPKRLRFDHKMRVQRPDPDATPDDSGNVDLTLESSWKTDGFRFFGIVPANSPEFYRAKQLEQTLTHVLKTHFDDITSTIDSTFRLIYDGRTFEVLSACTIDEANRVVSLICKETK